jgi:hypothetical protein
MFHNQPASKNQSLHGNALANSFPRNDPYVTISLNGHQNEICKVRAGGQKHSTKINVKERNCDDGSEFRERGPIKIEMEIRKT